MKQNLFFSLHLVRFNSGCLVALVMICLSSQGYAQNIGINETGEAPHPSAILDIKSADKGFLLPRVSLTSTLDVTTVTNCCATGLLVFNENTSGTPPHNVEPGFYYWDGTQWIPLRSGQTAGWLLQGNAGTIAGTHYLGTQDNVPVDIRVMASPTLRFNTNMSVQRDFGGLPRGAYALDFQYLRDSVHKVAGGYASFLGAGENNQVAGSHAAIVAGFNNRNSASNGFLGGGSYNTLVSGSDNSALISGYGNSNSGAYSIMGGGRFNELSGNYSVLMGGESNHVGGAFNTVGGGMGNVCLSGYNVIGGGQNNKAQGHWNAIGGGSYNLTQNWHSFVGGGNFNKAIGEGSVVVGGFENEASATLSVIVGGWANKVFGERGAILTGEQNTAYGDYATIVAGQLNYVNGLYSILANGEQNLLMGNHSCILGGSSNQILNNYSFLGGGQSNIVSGQWAAIAGGAGNNVSGTAASVVGGAGNQVPGTFSFIGGGKNNYSGGTYSFIGSGLSNSISSDYSNVAGGAYNNTSAIYSAIGGGFSNTVGGDYGVVAGGKDNKVSDFVGAVCGGMMNEAQGNSSFVGGGRANQAIGAASVIVGGSENIAYQAGSMVLGGDQNIVNGQYSIIFGGWNNSVSGDYVLLYGRNLDPVVNESYRFYLFGNGSNPWDPSPPGFLVINRLDGDHPIHVGTNGTNGNGAFLSSGGTWTNASTRSKKDRFTVLNADEVLEKVMQLQIEGWYYKETEEFHIGPYAEDFYAAFGTGCKDRPDASQYLAASDVAGVSLLALKALNKQLGEKLIQLENKYSLTLARLEMLEKLYEEKFRALDALILHQDKILSEK